MNGSGGEAKTSNKDGCAYFISGVKVPFPMKPYPQQITMMNKILKGLGKRQNCLLESPTGSGKTLSLLCSCLSWQRTEKEKVKAIQKAEESRRIQHLLEQLDSDKDNDPAPNSITDQCDKIATPNVPDGDISSKPKEDITCIDASITKSNVTDDGARRGSSDDLDFQSAKKRFRTPNRGLPSAKRPKQNNEVKNNDDEIKNELEFPGRKPTWRIEVNNTEGEILNPEKNFQSKERDGVLLQDKCSDKKCSPEETVRVPRIFFGTRTHKQIAQIIRELKKTDFKNVRMTILSSREHSCIHPVVSTGRDKSEECQRHVKGLDGKFCRFYGNSSMLSRPSLEKYNLNGPWDIEDLVTAGKKAKACPYYGAREMMANADIIFCPYNYLVDPFIRDQMDINLKDEIVVLDEAHNIEDSSREAASVSITSLQLQDAMVELDRLVASRVMIKEHGEMNELCSTVANWLETLSGSLIPSGFETSCKIFTGTELIERLRFLGITSSTLPKYKDILSKISEEYDKDGPVDVDPLKLSLKGTTLLRILLTALGNVLDNRAKFSEDYKIAVSRKAAFIRRRENTIGSWRNSSNGPTKTWVYSLNFWCLNPAAVFAELGNAARCIVLTSGTLSPMSSFSSELGITFPIQLEATHVIPDSQVWVGALTVGTNNQKIKANYQNSETFLFQEEVGKVILQICQTVPHGVLCFFPSYSMLEKLKKRWQITDIWEKISNVKKIYSEPRGSDRTELDAILGGFYKVANDDSSTGALLLAVCRGKISEGMDFTDDNARAVITIGVPFPDFRDKQVELKREYNNKHSSTRGLLTGSDWYEIQAYRALNQALGRCIRHRKDWGAILLLDERFGISKYKNGLSRWVRTKCKTFSDFDLCLESLKQFANARMEDPCPGDYNDSHQTKSNPLLATPKDTNDCSLTYIGTVKRHSSPERTGIRRDAEPRRCNSINTPHDSTYYVRHDADGNPYLTKEKPVPKQLSSEITRAHEIDTPKRQVPDRKANACSTNIGRVDGAFRRQGSLSFSKLSLLLASPRKPCDNAVEFPVDKVFNKTNDVIEIEDDEVMEKSCKIPDIIDLCIDDSAKTLEMHGKGRCKRRASELKSTPDAENCSEKSKAETPLLFSDSTVEIGSYKDAFWDSTDLEMSETVIEKVLNKTNSKAESNVTLKEETESGKRRKVLRGEGGTVKESVNQEEIIGAKNRSKPNRSLVDKVEADLRRNELDSNLNMLENGDLGDGSFSGVTGKDESSVAVKRKQPRKKARTRLAAKHDPIDVIDDIPADRCKKANFTCKHCLATLANQVEVTQKHINDSSVSKLTEPPTTVVYVLETSSWSFDSAAPLRSLTSRTTGLASEIKLNAFFSEDKSVVYIPLICTNCRVKSREKMLMGIRVIKLKPVALFPEDGVSQKDDLLLFPDHVAMDYDQDS